MLKISFPHLGDYEVPISYLLHKIIDCEIVSIPITKKTVELGSVNAPDSICIPFKYNLGNFIESLEDGSDVLIQAGGGCRYGYYAEVQEQILRDLGYDFIFINITGGKDLSIFNLYKSMKKLNEKLHFFKFIHIGLTSLLMIEYMDTIDDMIRLNSGFEVKKNSFNNLKIKMLRDFSKTKGIINLTKTYLRYKRKFKKLEINKSKNCLKVGIIGELYTNMEEASNYYLERELINMNIEVKRFTNVSYLLWKKRFMKKKMLKKCKKYAKYTLGADALDNIYRTLILIEQGYDGIIHIKPSCCTPEIGVIPILEKISNEYNIPIMFLSYETQTSIEGMNTRIEAFYDMIKEKRNKDE